MVSLGEVNQFMDDDILHTLDRLLNEFENEPDATSFSIAGAHFVFMRLTRHSASSTPNDRMPFLNEGNQQLLELLTIPSL